MNYPSDLTREQFSKIEPLLESVKKKTRPRTLDLYDVFNAILYVVKTGCQWRALPHDYPKFNTVHKYFRTWSTEKENGTTLLNEVLKKIGRTRTYEKWQKTLNDHGYY